MSNKKIQKHLKRLRSFYQQLHLTVLLENELKNQLGSWRALNDYRDQILDKINKQRRTLGYI